MANPTLTLPADKFDTETTFVRPDPAPTRAPLDKLAVLPGFNTRVKDADYNERVAGIAESIAAHGFFDDKPFAVTMLPNDDTIYIFDGEHRFDAAKQALLDGAEFPDGLPIAFAKDGSTVKDITIHLAHGNNGERLGMVELAAVVRRMQGLGMDKDEISAALGRTTRHVDNLIVLAAANQTVKKAVASGKIAGAEAVKLLRKDPATAAAKVTEAVKKAEERGARKATPKTMAVSAPAGPKMKTIAVEQSFPEGETVAASMKALAAKIRETIKFDGTSDKLLETGMVRVKIEVVDHEAEAAKAAAAAEKAEREAKRAEEKKAAEEKRAAEKKAAEAKKVEQAKLLAEAATKGSAAKKPTAPKKQAVEKPSKANGGVGGAPKATVKPAGGAKATRAALKPAETASDAPATQVAPEAGSSADGAATAGEDGNAGL